MKKFSLIILLGLIACLSSAQEIDRNSLKEAGSSLERFANMNHAANVCMISGMGLTTVGFLSGTDTEPFNATLVYGGTILSFAGWIISRTANRHIRGAGYHLQSADNGIGLKLVF